MLSVTVTLMVRLSPEDQKEALAIDGTEPFDPMGNGRTMSDSLLLSESVMDVEAGSLTTTPAR